VLFRRPIAAMFVASGVSLLIEIVQGLAPAMGRSCSTNDWLYNTLGAVLGALLAVAALALAQRPTSRDRSGVTGGR
jgi:VanZ family protein